jgi:hypothetical protein
MNALSPVKAPWREDPLMQALRDALGAIPAAPALAYSLHRAGAQWELRRLDRRQGMLFDTREAAFAAMRRAIVRCSAYFLLVEGCSGDLDVQFLNWGMEAAQTFGIRP